jgi:hypothetical protein
MQIKYKWKVNQSTVALVLSKHSEIQISLHYFFASQTIFLKLIEKIKQYTAALNHKTTKLNY